MNCELCDALITEETSQPFGGHIVCQGCAESNFLCSKCGALAAIGDMQHHEGQNLCQDCYNDISFICDNCGERYLEREYAGDGLCLCCWEEREEEDGIKEIKPYHSGSNCGSVFHPTNHEPLYFGVELETDEYFDRPHAAKLLQRLSNNDTLFWLEEDSSLNNGIEIISQPCTLDYHRTQFPWRAIRNIVTDNGGKSHKTNTCGLHIHFSRNFYNPYPNLQTVKLIYLFEKFWEPLVIFSRRTQDALNRNANKYNQTLFDCSAKRKVSQLHAGFYRYQAVNIVPISTIEIRIFRGTLDIDTLLASIELVDLLVRLAKNTSIKKLQALNWANLIRRISYKDYQYLLPYLKKKDLIDTKESK